VDDLTPLLLLQLLSSVGEGGLLVGGERRVTQVEVAITVADLARARFG
jgi:hypothetical protein